MIERILDNPWVLVGVGGCIGAISRYELTKFIQSNFNPQILPLGTLTVNVLGSIILGFLVTIQQFNLINQQNLLFAGTGFCGGFTTFSTFAVETVRLSQTQEPQWFTLNITLNVLLTLTGVILGIILANILVKQRIGL